MPHLRRIILPLVLTLALAGCGLRGKTFDDASAPRLEIRSRVAALTAVSPARLTRSVAALSRAQRRAFHRLIVHLWFARWLAGLPVEHYNWNALAQCETGGDWHMHGSYYSTGLGMMNAAIRENASPESAARQLSGSAPRSEIVATAEQIAARHGIRSWGCWRVA